MQDPKPAGLRISVVGGGCSGFSYSMAFENSPGMLDKSYASRASRSSSTRPAFCIWMAQKWITWRRWKVRDSSSITRT